MIQEQNLILTKDDVMMELDRLGFDKYKSRNWKPTLVGFCYKDHKQDFFVYKQFHRTIYKSKSYNTALTNSQNIFFD